MNMVTRFLLTVYALCLTVISFIAIIVTFYSQAFKNTSDRILENVLNNPNPTYKILMVAIELVFLALSVTFLFSGVKSNKDKRAVNRSTEIGRVNISLSSIESIALMTAKKVSGVKETKASVIKNENEDSVDVGIKVVVLNEVNIPHLCEDLQLKVKKSVEETSGIKVKEVKVDVENIYTPFKSRVE